MIGSVEGARRHGAYGTDADVTVALQSALERVQIFCGDLFEAVTEARVLRVSDGLAWSPCRLRGVTSVGTTGPGVTPTTLPASAWGLVPATGSLADGPDYLGVTVATGRGDGLIAGAEPWNGGWSNLYPSGLDYVEVAGQWGWLTPPSAIVEAVERLAGYLAPSPYVPAADAEGNPVAQPNTGATDPRPEPVRPADRLDRTTGLAAADRLVAPYRRREWRMG